MREWIEGLFHNVAGSVQDLVADTVLFVVAAQSHRILEWAISPMVPQGWIRAEVLLKEAVFVTFGIIYIALLYDILAVFVPFLKRMPRHNRDVDKHGQYRLPLEKINEEAENETT